MMDLTEVYVARKDFPGNTVEVINDILNRIYSQEDTTGHWDHAEDFLSWDSLECEEFVFLTSGSDGKYWDLDSGSIKVVERCKLTKKVDFVSWYAAIKEKFEI